MMDQRSQPIDMGKQRSVLNPIDTHRDERRMKMMNEGSQSRERYRPQEPYSAGFDNRVGDNRYMKQEYMPRPSSSMAGYRQNEYYNVQKGYEGGPLPMKYGMNRIPSERSATPQEGPSTLGTKYEYQNLNREPAMEQVSVIPDQRQPRMQTNGYDPNTMGPVITK